jgi:hypothetical protein
LISVYEAAARGITTLRSPAWRDPDDHIEIDVVDGKIGPWFRLHSSSNEICGYENPRSILWISVGTAFGVACFLPYEKSDGGQDGDQGDEDDGE